MKCQNCGNELGPDEVFCGQCGTPNAVQAQPTEMMQQTPASPGGLPGDGYRTRSTVFQPNQQANVSFPTENAQPPHPSMIRQNPQQAGGFYQDATEAVSIVPGTPVNYPQQGYSGGSFPGSYNGAEQFGTQAQQQPFLTGNYSNPTYPPTQMGYNSGQFGPGSYGSGSGLGITPPPLKRSNVIMIVGIVCLVFAIITVGIFGALFTLRNGGNNPAPTPVVQATPTATPTPRPTPSPTPSPTPTAAPTPAPDANFSWCGTSCTQNGYQIEVPNGWNQSQTQDGQGLQFADPSQSDIYLAVKTPSGGSSADALLNADINEFSSQPGYQPPQQGAMSSTIGGTNWESQTIYYQLNGGTEQVSVYATVYQGKGYVIELQAPQSQFATIDGQFFSPMLARFQFVTPGQ